MKTRQRPLSQTPSLYSNTHHLVWKTLFERQMNHLKKHACTEYLRAVEEIGFTGESIPNIDEINRILLHTTGWQLTIVPQIVDQADFFLLLSKRIFPVTVWLREMEELDYLEEPDMFHDVFGHVPLLLDKSYAEFFRGIAMIALEHEMDEEVVRCLGNIYWFTIEFGLIREKGEVKIYGAGICSSFGESRSALSEGAEHLPFDLQDMIARTFRTDEIQKTYYVTPCMKTLNDSLTDIANLVRSRRATEVITE